MEGPAKMTEPAFRIKTKLGHDRTLRFRIAPVSKKILAGDADWLNSEELCCDNLCAHEFFLPILKKYCPEEFKFRDWLNVMRFSDIRAMLEELNQVTSLLRKDYGNSLLDPYRKMYALDLLMPPDEYEAKFLMASAAEKKLALKDHIGVVAAFYQTIADYLNAMMDKYEPLGFHEFAVTAPV